MYENTLVGAFLYFESEQHHLPVIFIAKTRKVMQRISDFTLEVCTDRNSQAQAQPDPSKKIQYDRKKNLLKTAIKKQEKKKKKQKRSIFDL